MGENTENCRSCRFAVPVDSAFIGLWSGECRKNPPQLILTERGPALVFPTVPERLYCFSWEGKKTDEHEIKE